MKEKDLILIILKDIYFTMSKIKVQKKYNNYVITERRFNLLLKKYGISIYDLQK